MAIVRGIFSLGIRRDGLGGFRLGGFGWFTGFSLLGLVVWLSSILCVCCGNIGRS